MADNKKRKNKLFSSLDEIKKELFERSVWPTRQEVINQTVVVIILLIIAPFLGAADYVVTLLTRTLLDGSIMSSIISSRMILFLIAIVIVLVVIYFAIRYVRKNRYNR